MRKPRDKKPEGSKLKKSYYVRSPRPGGKQPPCEIVALVGARLAQLRREKGVTQGAVARAIGTSDVSICRWEKGKYMPPYDVLRAFVKYYGVTFDSILKD